MDEIKYKFVVLIKGSSIFVGEAATLDTAERIVSAREREKKLYGDFNPDKYEIVRKAYV